MNYDIDKLVHIIICHTGLDRDEALYLIEDISKQFEIKPIKAKQKSQLCPKCIMEWEEDSNQFGCWNCGFER